MTSRILNDETDRARVALRRAEDAIIRAQVRALASATHGEPLVDHLTDARRAVNDAVLSVDELAARVRRLEVA